MLAYADDIFFNKIVETIDCLTLQRDIKVISDWCRNNMLASVHSIVASGHVQLWTSSG